MWCRSFFFSSRRRHTRFDCDWSSDVCSSDLLGFYGVKSGLDAILSGFSGSFSYPADSFIADSNDLALALDMILPVLWFMVRAATRRWARYALRVAFGLTVLGILTTYSRGGFIGLCVVLIFMFTKSRTKALSFAL